MKLRMTKATVHGTVSIEEDVPTQGIVDVTRRVRAALDQAVAELVPHAPTIGADRTDGGAIPLPGPEPAREHYPPCEPPPSNGRELWRWGYNVGACKRILALGAACGYPARTRADVYRWFPDNVKHIYHELTVKAVKGARA